MKENKLSIKSIYWFIRSIISKALSNNIFSVIIYIGILNYIFSPCIRNKVLSFMRGIINDEGLRHVLLTFAAIIITNISNEILEKERTRGKIKLNALAIKLDMIEKIQAIQFAFRPKVKEDNSKCFYYQPFSSPAGLIRYKDLNEELEALSNVLSLTDIQRIRYFYINYELYIQPINEVLMKNNKDRIDLYCRSDDSKKCKKKLDFFYDNIIYKDKDVESILDTLREVIIEIKKEEDFMNRFKKDSEILNIGKINLSLHRDELKNIDKEEDINKL